MRPETTKLLEESIGEKPLDISLEWFLGYDTNIAQAKKAKIDKWEYIKKIK